MQPEIADLVREMREGLANVTPGPWEATRDTIWTTDGSRVIIHAHATTQCPREGDYYACSGPEAVSHLRILPPDLAHIARCSPDNIAALLDAYAAQSARISELERERDEARKEAEPVAWRVLVNQDGKTFNLYTERLPFEPLTDSTVRQKREPEPLYLAPAAESTSATLAARVADLTAALAVANDALVDAETQIRILGGDPRGDPFGDKIQAAVLDSVEQALAEAALWLPDPARLTLQGGDSK